METGLRGINVVTYTEIEGVLTKEPGHKTGIQCQCGGELIVRQGYSKFLGCSNYPDCKRTFNGKIPTIKRKEFRELPEPGTWEYEAEQNFFREKYGEPEYSYEDNDTFRLLMDF